MWQVVELKPAELALVASAISTLGMTIAISAVAIVVVLFAIQRTLSAMYVEQCRDNYEWRKQEEEKEDLEQ